MKELLASIEKTRREGKSYGEFILQARSMERLLVNEDFKRYQEVLRESFLLLVKRFQIAEERQLPYFQGAVAQCDFIMDTPKRLVEAAVEQIAARREAEDRTDGS